MGSVALLVGAWATAAPHTVAFEIGATEFHDGDAITITELSGDRRALEPGGTYHVKGRYKLASRDRADLLFALTLVGDVGAKPTQPASRVEASRGEGNFDLVLTLHARGYLHVSMYGADGHSFGGVYFGSGDWLLKNKSWRDQP
jgi:hypothetical protein